MTNKELIELYGNKKIGVHNTIRKKCLCGCEMDIGEKKCPACQTALPKAKLINVNKNTALAKRSQITDDGTTAEYICYNLMSKGFELYETEALKFSMNRETLEVVVSSSHVFKSLKDNKDFLEFLEKVEPGFYPFVISCLNELRHDYAVANFTSLNESQIKSFLNVYMNYRAMIPYMMKYKILYFGSKIDLKQYFPNIDFCDIESVKRTGILLDMVKTWDLKNERYFETIIEISQNTTKNQKQIISEIIKQMFQTHRVSYDDIINSFSILYNKEISIEDFIRIYQNSREDFFLEIYQYRNDYKKMNKEKIDWSKIEKLDRKLVGSMRMKKILKDNYKVGEETINSIYKILEDDPLKALKLLAG